MSLWHFLLPNGPEPYIGEPDTRLQLQKDYSLNPKPTVHSSQ